MANYKRIARQDARKYGLDPNIFGRQIKQESGYNPNAVSPAGARGIAQFMPGTARGLGVNPNNPVQALDAAAKLMASYVKKYGSYKNALVAYNAGPGRVGGPLPAETQRYVANILGNSKPSVGTARTQSPTQVSRPASPTSDTKLQVALSILGMGNYTGGYGGDSLTNTLIQAAQQGQIPRAVRNAPAPATSSSYGGKVAHFDGKPVVSWMVPILQQARQTGLWKGSVTSGVRTKQQQLQAAKNYGLQHYPHGPLASNHVEGHNGAVDVSDPQGLKRALKKLGVKKLKSSMPEDPVHFSATGY